MEGAHELAVEVGARRPSFEDLVDGGFSFLQVHDWSRASFGVLGSDGVVELAGGRALFAASAATRDGAAYGGGVSVCAGAGFPQPLEVAWAGFLVAEGFTGRGLPAPMCSRRVA